jgi:hypothetical protein
MIAPKIIGNLLWRHLPDVTADEKAEFYAKGSEYFGELHVKNEAIKKGDKTLKPLNFIDKMALAMNSTFLGQIGLFVGGIVFNKLITDWIFSKPSNDDDDE